MEPTDVVNIRPLQEAILVVRDLGIIGLLALFGVGLFRGWWTLGVKVQSDDAQGHRRRRRRCRNCGGPL